MGRQSVTEDNVESLTELLWFVAVWTEVRHFKLLKTDLKVLLEYNLQYLCSYLV